MVRHVRVGPRTYCTMGDAMSNTFAHLHLHTEYSLTDSTIRIPDLMAACRKAGLPAVAMTDDSNLFALVKFYREAEKNGIKPIIGCDLWISQPGEDEFRATVLCRNRDGYLRLSRLISDAYRRRTRTARVAVPRAALLAQHQDLFVLLGPGSDVGRIGQPARAERCLREWQLAFGDRLHLEAMRLGAADDEAALARTLHLAERLDVPVVATNNVRFLEADDFEAHEARVCISSGRVLNDPKRPREYTAQQYLKSADEMRVRFADLPAAIDNAVELAKRCNVEMSFGKYYLPAFPVPAEHTLESFIRSAAEEGLEHRLRTHGADSRFAEAEYRERLGIELDVINKMGFPGYFLIVADFINWAKRNDIPVGPGRGSGAGSLVAYALGITDLDPLPYDLLFERFLNPERVSMPDFDIDFCMEGRDRVIDYVGDKYGRDRVSQIITYGTMAAKAVVRDTGRVLGMSYGHVDSIAKLIPLTLGITLDKAIAETPELQQRIADEEEVATLIELAKKLEDLTRNAGKHAGGVVISPSDLTDFAPLYCIDEGEGVVTQFDKDDVEAAGLVKFDFLGLRTLTIIDWAVKAINARHARSGKPLVDINTLSMHDEATFALLKTHMTTAVFQLESRGMKDLVRKLQPDTFEDIIALVALFRPGPLQSGMVDDFIARKHGRSAVSYPHPLLEPILKPTYGVIVYQEQVMQIAQVLAGYTLGGADLLRRAMGKKKAEEMAEQRAIFEAGATKNGVDAGQARGIFDLMEKFAEYGFNKSHSAAYALVTYQTAWLKAHYPSEFMAAVLSSDMDNTDKLVGFLDDARAFRIEVLRPDVNSSRYKFEALDDGRVLYGLGAIKGVGEAACTAIVAERDRGGAFRDLAELCRRVDPGKLNKRVLEALIQSGACDGFGETRATLMNHAPEAMKAAEQHLRNHAAGQVDIFGGAQSESAPVTLTRLPEGPLLQRLNGERDTLGHYLSGHPSDAYATWLKQLVTCPVGEIEAAWRNGQGALERNRGRQELPIILGGVIPSALRRRGESMAFAQIEDASGRVEIALYREALTEFAAMLVKDQVVIIDGALSPDEFSGGFQVRVRNVWSIAQALERFARGLRVTIEQPKPAMVDELARSLKPLRFGVTPVRVLLRTGGAQAELQLGDDWRIRVVPELIDTLTALPGVQGVELSLTRAST
jgi:DNA polymerase-3 subunit alpha